HGCGERAQREPEPGLQRDVQPDLADADERADGSTVPSDCGDRLLAQQRPRRREGPHGLFLLPVRAPVADATPTDLCTRRRWRLICPRPPIPIAGVLDAPLL